MWDIDVNIWFGCWIGLSWWHLSCPQRVVIRINKGRIHSCTYLKFIVSHTVRYCARSWEYGGEQITHELSVGTKTRERLIRGTHSVWWELHEREDVLRCPKNNDRLKRMQNDQLKMKRHFEHRDEISRDRCWKFNVTEWTEVILNAQVYTEDIIGM